MVSYLFATIPSALRASLLFGCVAPVLRESAHAAHGPHAAAQSDSA